VGSPVEGSIGVVGQSFWDGLSRLFENTESGDVRRRLADALEGALRDVADQTALLPSTRSIARAAGVHRNTARGALEMLVERSLLEYTPSGRFLFTSGLSDGCSAIEEVRESVMRARQAGVTQSELISLVRSMYAQGQNLLVFVEPTEDIPGIGPEDLAETMGHPVSVIPLDALVVNPGTLVVALSSDVSAVRAKLHGGTDVFAVGLAFDMSVRLAVDDVAPGARVAVMAGDDGVLAAVSRRIAHARPDLVLEWHSARTLDRVGDADVVVAPDHTALTDARIPVRRYRCGISAAEQALIRARLDPRSERPVADSGWTRSEVDGLTTGGADRR
jgi:DNA-binding transcriptional regulator YhcF (GntR family)